MQKLTNPSQEELFDLWAAELIEAGFIKEVFPTEQIPEFKLFEGLYKIINVERTVFKGTDREEVRSSEKNICLLKPAVYTPDRAIIWDKSAENIFYSLFKNITSTKSLPTYFIAQEQGDRIITLLDVKAPFSGKNSSDVSFSIKKKIVWEKYNLLVNQSVNYPIKKLKNLNRYLWCKTFTPLRYFWSDGLTKERSINNWNPITLSEFLKQQKGSI